MKVDPNQYSADFVEITFQDQYLGRADMWRIGTSLRGQCVYVGQEISFLGSVAGNISNIYIQGVKVDILSVLMYMIHLSPLLGPVGTCQTHD